MKRASTTLGCLLLVLSTSTVFAQVDSGGTTKRTFRHDQDIETQFDKKSDTTKVEIRRMLVPVISIRNDPTLNLSIYFTYPGRTPKRPESIVLGFISVTTEQVRKFQDFRELKVSLDGKTESLGTPELLEGKILPRAYREVLAMYLPYQTFLRIINTKQERVELWLGRVNFLLNWKHLEALRDLASRTE